METPGVHAPAQMNQAMPAAMLQWAGAYGQSRANLRLYAIPGFELGEELARAAEPAVLRILKALADAVGCIGARRNVRQMLIRCRILNDGGGFSFCGADNCSLRGLDLLHEIARAAANVGILRIPTQRRPCR